ncbi:MAG TPA: glyoxalase/bleomycin resistance/extradiol dioxygenase family protein [Polyangiaceae bacterium]|jgi:PhnB protein|nr:glyoxalase/bleomycin resistance/extradiol dioxygenase family protein [Polyangiaceae bacterium]
MIKMSTPYLNFNGTGAKAIALYEKALGAKAENVMKFSDIPGEAPKPENEDRVVHATLHLGAGLIMLSDTPADRPAPPAGNTHVCLEFDDVADQKQKFDALAVGGQVTMPLMDTFWGATFGMLIDAYGISWMFNCTKK